MFEDITLSLIGEIRGLGYRVADDLGIVVVHGLSTIKYICFAVESVGGEATIIVQNNNIDRRIRCFLLSDPLSLTEFFNNLRNVCGPAYSI